MKSILAETIGMVVACIACVVVFCGLQCVALSAYLYDAIREFDS